MTLEWLSSWKECGPENTAFIDPNTGLEYNYSDLFSQASQGYEL